MHGNEPSRGAKVDREIADEEAALLAERQEQTDGLMGKKMEASEGKTVWKQSLDAQDVQSPTVHSNQAATTGRSGMEYVARKKDTAHP